MTHFEYRWCSVGCGKDKHITINKYILIMLNIITKTNVAKHLLKYLVITSFSLDPINQPSAKQPKLFQRSTTGSSARTSCVEIIFRPILPTMTFDTNLARSQHVQGLPNNNNTLHNSDDTKGLSTKTSLPVMHQACASQSNWPMAMAEESKKIVHQTHWWPRVPSSARSNCHGRRLEVEVVEPSPLVPMNL